jgi:hypothetical protein
MKTNWLSQFLKRLTFKGERNGDGPGSDECFEQVDRFVEMVLDGRDAAEALPLVQDHLNRCDDCREEFEALVDALHALS